MCGLSLGINEKDLYACYVDSQKNIDELKTLFRLNGHSVFMIQYQLDDAPSPGNKFFKKISCDNNY